MPLALEDLTGIRETVTVRREHRYERHCWAFSQLRLHIAYKAAWAGVPVYLVDPAYTSQTCSRCGYGAAANRQSQASFLCQQCGFCCHADINAAINISLVARQALEFASLSSFNRGNAKNRAFGNYSARLPLPSYVFPYLAKRWEEVAPPELVQLVQREAIEHSILEEGVIISDYDFKPHIVKFSTHWQPGFMGSCTYSLRGPDEPTTADAPLTVQQQLLLLADLAFYTGVGYKTAMGMGRARLI